MLGNVITREKITKERMSVLKKLKTLKDALNVQRLLDFMSKQASFMKKNTSLRECCSV